MIEETTAYGEERSFTYGEEKEFFTMDLKAIHFPVTPGEDFDASVEKQLKRQGYADVAIHASDSNDERKTKTTLKVHFDWEDGFVIESLTEEMLRFDSIEHEVIQGIDTRLLDERMQRVNWTGADKATLSGQALISSLDEDAMRIAADLETLKVARDAGRWIAEKLILKHWFGTPAERMLDNRYDIQRRHLISHTFCRDEYHPKFNVTEARNLLLGRAVYQFVPEEDGHRWLIMTANDRHRYVNLHALAAHYNYDIKAVLGCLPIASDEATLVKLQTDLRSGEKLLLPSTHAVFPQLLLSAAPLGRTLLIEDAKTGETLSMEALDCNLPAPLSVDHYELYHGQRLIEQSKDRLVLYERLKRLNEDLRFGVEFGHRREWDNTTLIGVSHEGRAAVLSNGRPANTESVLVASIGPASNEAEVYIAAADIETGFEAKIRQALKSHPYFSAKSLKNLALLLMHEPLEKVAASVAELLPPPPED